MFHPVDDRIDKSWSGNFEKFPVILPVLREFRYYYRVHDGSGPLPDMHAVGVDFVHDP
jgi:hypothetical protein